MNNDDPELQRAIATLPSFAALDDQTIVEQLQSVLADNERAIDDLFADRKQAATQTDWDKIAKPLEDYGDRLHKYWSPVSHLHSVADSPALRTAYNEALPLLSEYANAYAQDERIFRAFVELNDGRESLTPARQRVIDNALRDFRLNGVDLDNAAQSRLRELKLELTRLGAAFEENVLDATNRWEKTITDADLLAGLPESARDVARQRAQEADREGWVFSLDFPSYHAVVTHSDIRELRAEFYHAYTTRASETGPNAGEFDNSANIEKILELRLELARVLGFEHYAEYSLATKMAGSSDEVLDFLNDLARLIKPHAARRTRRTRTLCRRRAGPSRTRSLGYRLRQREITPVALRDFAG